MFCVIIHGVTQIESNKVKECTPKRPSLTYQSNRTGKLLTFLPGKCVFSNTCMHFPSQKQRAMPLVFCCVTEAIITLW